MTLLSKSGPRAILLDIEGTIAPISFVHEVLFPYARAQVKYYLAQHYQATETIADLLLLREEHALDLQRDREPPPLAEAPVETVIDSFARYVFW